MRTSEKIKLTIFESQEHWEVALKRPWSKSKRAGIFKHGAKGIISTHPTGEAEVAHLPLQSLPQRP